MAGGNVYRQEGADGYVIRWIEQGRRRGRLVKTTSVKVAREALAAEKARVEKARILGQPLPSEETFAHWADEFLKFQQQRITPQVVRGKLSRAEFIRQKGIIEAQLKPFFGTMKLATIRRGDVVRFIHRREGEVSSGTVIKEMNCLKRIFNVALDLEKIGANPAQRAPLPKAPEGRMRFLTPDEWTRVFAACRIPPDIYGNEQEQWLQQATALAVSLGTRRGELMAVTVPDVDLHHRQVALRKTKNGKPRTVYINNLAMQVFASMGLAERKHKQDRGVLWPSITPEQLSMRFLCRHAPLASKISRGTISGIRSRRT